MRRSERLVLSSSALGAGLDADGRAGLARGGGRRQGGAGPPAPRSAARTLGRPGALACRRIEALVVAGLGAFEALVLLRGGTPAADQRDAGEDEPVQGQEDEDRRGE